MLIKKTFTKAFSLMDNISQTLLPDLFVYGFVVRFCVILKNYFHVNTNKHSIIFSHRPEKASVKKTRSSVRMVFSHGHVFSVVKNA